jgi:hypothetical protein
MVDPDMDLKRRHSIDNTVVFFISPKNTPHHRYLSNKKFMNFSMQLFQTGKKEMHGHYTVVLMNEQK